MTTPWGGGGRGAEGHEPKMKIKIGPNNYQTGAPPTYNHSGGNLVEAVWFRPGAMSLSDSLPRVDFF